MEWRSWKYWYQRIISDFGFDPTKDFKSSLDLNEILRKKVKYSNFEELRDILWEKVAFIYGCGPSLPIHLNLLKESLFPIEKFTHIAADGATSALLEFGIVPDIIVTDLDGLIPDLIKANEMGARVVIHAHGDNSNKIDQYASSFPGKLHGSTQNKPLSNVKNFGGFTDGDRCVFLAVKMGVSKIILFGFDFGDKVGKYSKPYLKHDELANDTKKKKLDWAKKLLTELSENSNVQILKIDGNKVKLGKIVNIGFEDLPKALMSSQS